MALLVSHAMHRFHSSPDAVVSSNCGLRREGSRRADASNNNIPSCSSSNTTGALSRSMRYAEPWLYGTVRASGGLLLAPALVLCQCPEYLTGSKRYSSASASSKKSYSSSSSSMCKRCNGTRLPLLKNNNGFDSKFGTVRCYPSTNHQEFMVNTPLKAGTVRVTSSSYSSSSSSRPSILPSAAASDPYDLMRRSRLSVPETISSVSPFRDIPTTTPKSSKVSSSNQKSKCKSAATLSAHHGRKSILECDVNPYELMSNEKLPQSKEDKNSNKKVALVNGQRIRLRSNEKHQQDYEDVQVPNNYCQKIIPNNKSLSQKIPDPVRLISTPTKSEKYTDLFGTINLSTNNTFKSILKKRGTNYNSDSYYSDAEEFSTPTTSPRKTNSKFYVPVQLLLTPRKKVQFADSNGDKDTEEVEITQKIPPLEIAAKQVEAEDVFEDALQEIPNIIEVEKPKQVISEKKIVPKICRSNSDCSVPDGIKNVDFFDTMALRTRNKRADSRNLFAEKDLAKLDGLPSSERVRKISPLKTRPNIPPPPPPSNKIEERKIEEAPKMKDIIPDTPPSAPPRKRSNNKQPSINIITITDPPLAPASSSAVSSIKIESPSTNKTVVQISSPTPVHKIKIKNQFANDEYDNNTELIQNISVIENPQRKTSILINGDDCYSTVINDNIPLYQSSVVVNDESPSVQITTTLLNNSSKVYITGNSAEQNIPKAAEMKKEEKIEIISESDELLKELLRDPVEAVRHNLVPHVCGKSEMVRRQRDRKFINKPTLPMAKAESLLESSLEDSTNLLPISVEDSFLRLKNYESLDDDGANECEQDGSPYELMDQGSECYTDHSNRSSITEEELANRTKFYELLTECGNIEVSEGDDHHYESIKINNDPIYEEIELPPPLPANPPPSSILDDLQLDKEYTTRSIFEGASKYDILSYLVDAKERGIVQEEGYTYPFSNSTNNNNNNNTENETKESYNRVSHMSTVSDSSEDNSLIISGALIDEKATFQKPAEVERNDSGVGSETSKSSLSKYRTKPEIFACCEDCESVLESNKAENEPLLCRKCSKKRSERKEIITEIVETEEKYSRDLQIILEEFYQPMLVAGLLTPDQLSAIFLNVEELLENSQALAERLRDAVEIALEQGDDDLLTVNIGKLFLEAAPMLHAFETYCIRQGTASLLLASLEKEKELLRIFLRVSQMENTMLRRMNLNSFLMVPVQRVTKYPLLLARLFKVTLSHHETRNQLKEAQHKIELHLNHMNSETKDVPSKLWRRIGSNSGRRSSAEMDLVNIKLRKIAVDVLDWNHEEARFILEGKLLFTQPTDNNWRKGRTIKLTPVNALLVINGKTPSNKTSTEKNEESSLVFSMRNSGIREAALLLVRDKNGRYSLLREPLYLDRCVIAADPAWQSYFEVQELLNKDTFIFKAEDEEQTHVWYKKLQYHAQGMGAWRKRRNALANIMINGMGLRS